MIVPFVDLKAQYAPIKQEILSGVSNALDGMQLFLGENVQQFEKEFASFCDAKHGIGVSDGTAALHIILRAMDIGPGDEVITVAHTFIASAEAIVLAGATPIFVDIDPTTYLMDVAQVEAKITSHTRAIMPVHLYGQTVDMDPLLEIAERRDLWVIEDACQAHGAEYKGRKAGSMGDAAAFSFYYSKNLGAYGEGGLITTNNSVVAARARMIRDHGSGSKYNHDLLGFNGRLDELQAAVLRAKLPYLNAWNEERRENAFVYTDQLAGTPAKTPVICPENLSVFHLYVIRTPMRDELQLWLREHGVFTGIHYPIPLHLQKSMLFLGYQKGDFPVTEAIANEILSLPMFAELHVNQIGFVTDKIKEFYAEHNL